MRGGPSMTVASSGHTLASRSPPLSSFHISDTAPSPGSGRVVITGWAWPGTDHHQPEICAPGNGT